MDMNFTTDLVVCSELAKAGYKPYAILSDGWECISFPFPREDGSFAIKARVKDDPTTIVEREIPAVILRGIRLLIEQDKRLQRLQTKRQKLRRDLRDLDTEISLVRRNVRALTTSDLDPDDQLPPRLKGRAQ